jgi:hypothetical protein
MSDMSSGFYSQCHQEDAGVFSYVLKERRVENKDIRRIYEFGNSEGVRETLEGEERRNERKQKE